MHTEIIYFLLFLGIFIGLSTIFLLPIPVDLIFFCRVATALLQSWQELLKSSGEVRFGFRLCANLCPI